jgi:protein required for attachment to host cells
MATLWILLASRSRARLFQRAAPLDVPELLSDLSHPEGRFKNQELDTDRPGMTYASWGGGGPSAMPASESAKEHDAKQWAATIVQGVSVARKRGEYDQLLVVAEPRFLGYLREAMDGATTESVVGWVHKNLDQEEGRELWEHLGPLP